MIGVIDYGMGNIASVIDAVEYIGYDAMHCRSPEEIDQCERIIIPGVGSFRNAMKALNSQGWVAVIREYANNDRPILGICLGMQLLFGHGYEDGKTDGFGLISGEVTHLTPPPPLKVPHVGWNSLNIRSTHPVLKGLKERVDLYFVHSYHCVPEERECVIATCTFGNEFVAAAGKNSVLGLQFHPEKSQPSGLRILENFIDWDGTC